MKLSELLAAQGFAPPTRVELVRLGAPRGTVLRSDDFDRVDALPRRNAWCPDGMPETRRGEWAELYAHAMTRAFTTPAGMMVLRPIQAIALAEARRAGGLLGAIGVGRGKTLLSVLLPTMLDSTRTVLLTAPSLLAQTRRALAELSQHWRIHRDSIEVVSYSKLSVASGAKILDELRPDLVIADEAHYLRHPSAARTKRFLRYFATHPDTRFCALSGTITSRSLRDYAHLARLALRESAPVPFSRQTLDDWARALDEGLETTERLAPGVLLDWCAEGESPRSGYRRRLLESQGVVATTDDPAPAGLEIVARPLRSLAIAAALRQLQASGCAPDGTELPDAMAIARVARQLACGGYLRWVWPGEPDTEWLEARNRWSAAVRRYLEHSASAGLDSPLLLAQAVQRGELPELAAPWARWAALRDRPEPPVEWVHLCNDLVRDAAHWAHASEEPGIVWTDSPHVGTRIAAEAGAPWYGAGADASLATELVIVCSIAAQGTGRNLQRYSRNLVVSPPASGATWEQLVGRTWRSGQTADVVTVEVYQHAEALRGAVEQARRDARYISESTGQPQALELATWV